MENMNRRRALRGMLGGGAITVGLPLLNIFLNGNGTALASGEPLPTRFGTWLWGLGMNKQIFTPKKFGADFDLPPEIESLKHVKRHINLFSNFNTFRDASPLMCHHTGWVILRSGIAPSPANARPGETIDVTVAKRIGNTTRFQILSATATGDVRDSYSYENTNSINPPEWSPVRFYQKLFGPDYQDPNAATFVPNPRVMIRKSVLTGVLDESKSFQQKIGAEDRHRLDQYFTGLRDLERQFEMQLVRPKPLAACKHIEAPTADPPAGLDAGLVSKRHRMMTDIMVMALACDQTRVFNMGYAAETASTSKPGYEKPHHTATHEEPEGPGGYQEEVSWFTRRAMEEWAYFVEAFAKTPEGDGTLLDHTLAYALSDISYARIHSLDGIPMFTAGKAGGKLKTGLHIDGASSPGTRVGYTAMKIMGLDVPQWGTLSNQTSKDIGDILV